jgi:predicted Zn-dependent protease
LKRKILLLTAPIVVVAASVSFTAATATAEPRASQAPAGVALAPLGDFPSAKAQALAAMIKRRYKVQAVVVQRIALPTSAYDATRRQYRAEELEATIVRTPGQLPPGVTALIALTNRDLYAPSLGESWAFAYKSARLRLVINSTARLDPSFFGLHADKAMADSRLRKLIGRAVGRISYGRPLSDDPRSVLSRTLLSMDDLDFMTESFVPAPIGIAKGQWLSGVGLICTRGSSAVRSAGLATPSTPAEAIARLRKVLALERRWFPPLKHVAPAPADRPQISNLRSTLDALISVDRQAIAALSAHWSTADYRRWLVADGSLGTRAIWLSLGLGSKPCGQFVESI